MAALLRTGDWNKMEKLAMNGISPVSMCGCSVKLGALKCGLTLKHKSLGFHRGKKKVKMVKV